MKILLVIIVAMLALGNAHALGKPIRCCTKVPISEAQQKPLNNGAQAKFSPDCSVPDSAETPALDSYSIPGMMEVSCNTGSCSEKSNRPHYSRRTIADWGHLTTVSEFCFLGEVNDVVYKCISVPKDSWGGVQSVAFVEFDVVVPFWGIEGRKVIVETLVARPENCITYSRPFFPGFAFDQKFLVFGKFIENRMRCFPDGLYVEDNGEFFDPLGNLITLEAPLNEFEVIKINRSLQGQHEASDIAAEIEVVHISSSYPKTALVQISKIFKGNSTSTEIEVELIYRRKPLDKIGNYVLPPKLSLGDKYLVFLNQIDGPIRYSFVSGFHGVYPISGKDLYNYKGRYWGPYSLALATIGVGND